MKRSYPIVVAAWLLAGCHLIFPFQVDESPDSGSDGPAVNVDAVIPAHETGLPDMAADAGPGWPKLHWHKALGGIGDDESYGVALDSSDNVYLAGSFREQVDLGGGIAKAIASHDIFVTSFTPAGAHHWQVALGGHYPDYCYSLALDGDSNIYLTGGFWNTTDLGGGPLVATGSSTQDLYVTSFKGGGAHRWQKGLGGISSDYGLGVAVDGSGNVYLTGTFYTKADLGGGDISSKGVYDILLTSFTADGTHRWQKALGGVSSDLGQDIAVDGSGNVYLTGYFHATADLGGGDLTAKGVTDAFITSFAADGKHRWQKALGGNSEDRGYAVTVDGSGNVYVTGGFSGTADLGGGDLTSKGNTDIFVTSFTADGKHRWQAAMGGGSPDNGLDVAVDSTGNVYLTGHFFGTANLGGDHDLTSKGSFDIFATSFTTDGAHRWQLALGGAASDEGRGVAVDDSGGVYITGSFQHKIDLGDEVVASKGGKDVFLVKLRPWPPP